MDLRWKLFGTVLGFALALLTAAAAWIGGALQRDATQEMAASARLVDAIRAASAAPGMRVDELERLLGAEPLRHVRLQIERSNLEHSVSDAPAGPMDLLAAALLGERTVPEQRIPLADGVLVVRADAHAEIREILWDGAGLMLTLLVFSVAMAVVAWLAAHRALKPVRELEAGLARIARDTGPVRLPEFELREFSRIGVAIERLAGDLARERADRQTLARRLVELQEAERRELARELHDEVGQALTAMGVRAAFIERHAGRADAVRLSACARDIRTESGRLVKLVGTVLARLRPRGLDDGAQVAAALDGLVRTWQHRAPEVAIEADLPARLPALPPSAGLALYRTLQEALTNALRHSLADRVTLSLRADADAIDLVVSDNGGGRATDVAARGRGGLLGMRERAEMAGGRVWLSDGPDGGLSVRLSLPLHGGDRVPVPAV